MPAAPGNPEAVARVVLEKTPPAGATLSGAQKEANRIRKILKEKGPRSAIEGLRAGKPVDRARNADLIDRNIGTERKANGTKSRPTGSEEDKRFRKAQEHANLAEDLLEKGYDNLTTAQQEEALKFVETVLETWPDGKALLNSSPDDKKAAIETILRDSSYAVELRPLFEGSMDPSRVIEDTVAEAKKAFNQAKGAEDAKKLQLSKNKSELTKIKTELSRFNDGSSGPEGDKYRTLKDLEAKLPTMLAEKEVGSRNIARLEQKINGYNRAIQVKTARGEDTLDVESLMDDAQRELADTQKRIVEINQEVGKIQGLNEEKARYQQEQLRLEQEGEQREDELRGLTQERLIAQADLGSAKALRLGAEQEFVDGLKGVFSEAAINFLDKRIQEAEEIQRQLIDKEKAETDDPDEKLLLDDSKNRWEKEKEVGRIKKRKIKVPDKEQIKKDFDLLMTKGAKELIVKMLKDRGKTDDEIEEKLRDREFVAKMTPKVVERLVTMKVRTGTLREEDITQIVESDWGEGMIEKAIANNKAVKEAVDQLKDKGVLEQGWIKKKSQGSVLKLLLLLFGSIATAGVLPAGMAMNDVLHGSINK